MTAQWREIDDVNKEWAGRFHVIKGIEANILTGGELDLTSDELRGVELVLAAPHSKLRTNDDQTSRLIAAIHTPGVHVLAHARGRMSDSRPGLSADWPRVFAAAAERNVAIEIDGDPARQDIDYTLPRLHWKPVAYLRSTAMRTTSTPSGTRKRQLRTRASPTFRLNASSIAGRSSSFANG
jgi:DNA polymerase (family 10)